VRLGNHKMKKIKIIGVPEHFNYPWIKLIESQPFQAENFTLEWISEPKGSGAMNEALRKGEADLAIVLTESFIRDKTTGNPGQIIGYHVKSPLTWGIHTSPKNSSDNLSSLLEASNELKILVSRFGSGSHLMSYLLAEQENIKIDQSSFLVINDLEGAKNSISNVENGIFLWEKYTTKPLVNQGYFNYLGEINTPWPCFVIVAHKNIIKENPEIVEKIRNEVYSFSKRITNDPEIDKKISEYYNISQLEIISWLSRTNWATDALIKERDLRLTLDILKKLDLIDEMINSRLLVHEPFIEWDQN